MHSTLTPLFSGSISIADFVLLYLAYCRLLKLTATSNAGGV